MFRRRKKQCCFHIGGDACGTMSRLTFNLDAFTPHHPIHHRKHLCSFIQAVLTVRERHRLPNLMLLYYCSRVVISIIKYGVYIEWM
jgi:hypothetical protein